MYEIILIGFFFLLCNYCIGSFIVFTFTRLFREGCGGYVCILLWPHWIFCLFFPLLIGTSSYNIWVGIVLLIVTGVIPYLYWVIKFNFTQENNGNQRTMPCCSCIRKNVHKRKLEESIICKKVVEEDAVRGSDDVQNSGDNDATRSVGTVMSFRSKHPKSDLIIKKKREEKKITDHAHNDESSTNTHRQLKRFSYFKIHDEEALFPVSLPSEKGCDNESVGDVEIGNESAQKSIGTSLSVQFCNICLEEYKVGEEIGWSKNDLCHHVFHKTCILEWLVQHQDCPVCRNKY